MKTYQKHDVVSFLKTKEAFGGLSNMAAGYPITLYGIRCRSSEHLYQALKFPEHPELQSQILSVASPMGAKMVAKKHRKLIRPDWEEIKLPVMAYCLRAKLSTNSEAFGDLLRSTGDADIVEISSKHDTYWGCVPQGDVLVGHNHLGVLLTNLRDGLVDSKGGFRMTLLAPPKGIELRLTERRLEVIDFEDDVEAFLQDILVAIYARNSAQQANATIGGF